jgi:hypothetical protein
MARIGQIAYGLEIVLRQRHEGFVTSWPCPSIAINAANQAIAV